MPFEDNVLIVVGGQAYSNWARFDIDSDLFSQADAFSVQGSLPSKGLPEAFREGEHCDVYIDGSRQLTGVIDEVSASGSRHSTTLEIQGRDLAAFLVDCETEHIKPSKYTVKTLIEKLIDPSFGIRSVIFSNEENRKLLLGKKDKKPARSSTPAFLQPLPRARSKVDPGQRVASIIDEHAKRLGVTWWLTAGGDLFIGRPNYKQEAAYSFACHAEGSRKAGGNNIEQWDVKRSINGRYSEIFVVGQGFTQPAQLFDTGKGAPKYKATTQDPDLQARKIKRKTIFSDSDITSQDEAKARADLEMGKARLAGLVITLTVPDFGQNNRLYAIDTMASVKIEEAGIDGLFYVTQRRFTEDRNRRRTQITLHEPNLWLPQPAPKVLSAARKRKIARKREIKAEFHDLAFTEIVGVEGFTE